MRATVKKCAENIKSSGQARVEIFFLMTLRVPLIHYVNISRMRSYTCLYKILIINVQNQQFSATPNSSNVTNLAKRGEFC